MLTICTASSNFPNYPDPRCQFQASYYYGGSSDGCEHEGLLHLMVPSIQFPIIQVGGETPPLDKKGVHFAFPLSKVEEIESYCNMDVRKEALWWEEAKFVENFKEVTRMAGGEELDKGKIKDQCKRKSQIQSIGCCAENMICCCPQKRQKAPQQKVHTGG
uniref:Uncharacterized protein n=1 Tax=Heterosigma akashiwo TaxID=2829 RepID=A0A6V2S3X4_HETAK|mmetsp:Transcript_28657/g.49684  ORF Transcript_28657/g.49684 Transcript_28657/m.49684 type:complete len:160 (-) Transcript_28657:416-895(-)